MYEELIKALRERAAWINFPNHGEEYPVREAKLMYDAADAIEELSKENEQFAKMAKVLIDGMNDISDKCADIAGIQAEPPKEADRK